MIPAFSRRQIKTMDRVGGANLILPWPKGLPRGMQPKLDHPRPATAEERAAAEDFVRRACLAAGLTPVHVRVVSLNVPHQIRICRDRDEIWQCLAVTIIGNRWVHATGQRDRAIPDLWLPAEYYRMDV